MNSTITQRKEFDVPSMDHYELKSTRKHSKAQSGFYHVSKMRSHFIVIVSILATAIFSIGLFFIISTFSI